MDARQDWLEALWPKVLGSLPPPPAVVVELGCGRHGGFVPALTDDGFKALGIDPAAPEGANYLHVEFERAELPPRVHAIVACTSLHHVGDPAAVVDTIADQLAPGGVVVVIEWDWARFDRATAEWCFARLAPEADRQWLHRHRERWTDSGQPWEEYLHSWAEREHVHSGGSVVDQLDRRFERLAYDTGAYFFPDLAGTTEADELEAIGAGRIRATRIDYTGRRRG